MGRFWKKFEHTPNIRPPRTNKRPISWNRSSQCLFSDDRQLTGARNMVRKRFGYDLVRANEFVASLMKRSST